MPTRSSPSALVSRDRCIRPVRAALRRAIDIVEARRRARTHRELIGPLALAADCNRRQLLDPTAAGSDDARRPAAPVFHDPMAPIGPALSPARSLAEGERALERAVAIASSGPTRRPWRSPTSAPSSATGTSRGQPRAGAAPLPARVAGGDAARRSTASRLPSACSASRSCCTSRLRPILEPLRRATAGRDRGAQRAAVDLHGRRAGPRTTAGSSTIPGTRSAAQTRRRRSRRATGLVSRRASRWRPRSH